MSEKRRDNKGRILRTGESQRKDGRYAYKYIDALGKPQFVYSWKLVATDKTPAGKRELPALRDKIKEISRDLEDGIDTIGKKMTVCQLYAKQNGLTTFGFKIMPRSTKICQVSPDMTNGEKALKSKTYRHLPRYEKIG